MVLQIPPDLNNSSAMFPADGFSVVDTEIFGREKCIEELERLIRLCDIGLQCLGVYRLDNFNYSHLCNYRQLCRPRCFKLDAMHLELAVMRSEILFNCYWSLDLEEQVRDLGKKVKQAYSDAVSHLVIFSISCAVKGGIYINIGSQMIWAPDNLSVHHPLLEMVLFADRQFHDGSFGCLKSIAPKRIARMMATSGSAASPTEYIADWISEKHKSESPNAVRNPPYGTNKPLMPVLFNISESKKTGSTVSAIPQSGDNVKSVSYYDSSMTVAQGNCGVSYKSNLELGKAGSGLSFQEESNNCQQQEQGTLTGGSHDAGLQVPILAQEVACIYSISKDKMPTAAGSVKCADDDEGSLLTKQTSPREQFILNSSGDGGSGHPHSNSDLRFTPFAGKTFTPMVTELTEIDPQHLRGLSLAAKNNKQQGASMLMMYGGGGTDGVSIIDSGGAVHASGNISHFTQLGPEPRGERIFAANRQQMPTFGYGSICIRSLGLELGGVYYVPCLGNKTIVSVDKLNELSYSVNFSRAGCSIRDDRTWTRKLVGEARRVNGQFELDYLKIPVNRAPVSDGNLALLWRATWSKWNRLTTYLFQRNLTPSSERLPQ